MRALWFAALVCWFDSNGLWAKVQRLDTHRWPGCACAPAAHDKVPRFACAQLLVDQRTTRHHPRCGIGVRDVFSYCSHGGFGSACTAQGSIAKNTSRDNTQQRRPLAVAGRRRQGPMAAAAATESAGSRQTGTSRGRGRHMTVPAWQKGRRHGRGEGSAQPRQ